ncbi:hypothetical protein ACFX13_040387 [Malus domestica]
MEAKCVMLLWLSILVLVPFDISTVDTSIANKSNLGNLSQLLCFVEWTHEVLSSLTDDAINHFRFLELQKHWLLFQGLLLLLCSSYDLNPNIVCNLVEKDYV